MKIIQFYIGLDVHESITAYAVRSFKGEILKSDECATRYEDLHQVLEPYLHSSKLGLESYTSYNHIYWSFKKQ